MQPMPSMGYDRAITVFSPDGRLFQVEYAREAVKRGTTSIGIRYKDGVLLAIDKRIASRLIESESIEKIFQIDENIGAATSGLVADSRIMIDRARVDAQVNRTKYNEAIETEVLAKKICDYKQMYTQHGGARPFGIALLIAGVNDTPKLFETDPSGALIEYKATAIGIGRGTAMEIFEEKYTDGLDRDGAIDLAMGALSEITEGELSDETVEMAFIEVKNCQFTKMSKKEIRNCISKVKKHTKKVKE
jgi:proteasome alpha subunit|tara:strand:- start:98 stop:838 length:741 start_codon:yes stop_codon:yes gene_type:complete